MTAPTVQRRLAAASEMTATSILRIGFTDYPVAELDLYVTPSGARSVQLPGEAGRRTFLAHDIVTLVVPALLAPSLDALKARTA